MKLSEAVEHSKGTRRAKFSKVMREYYANRLHSGSKQGPLVSSRAQAQAIAASESGTSRKY